MGLNSASPDKSKLLSSGNLKTVWKVSIYGLHLQIDPYFDYLVIWFQEDPSQTGLESSRFTEKIIESTNEKVHVQYSAMNHCPLQVGRLIIVLRFLHQLLYGFEIFSVPAGSRRQNTANAAVLRRMLNCSRTDC